MAYELETGVARPTANTGRKSKYPVAGMKVGHSFMVPEADVKLQNLRSSMYAASVKFGYQLSIRKVEGGYRVWRTYKKP